MQIQECYIALYILNSSWKIKEVKNMSNVFDEMSVPEFLMAQGKFISQMVAYIWRWADDPGTAKGEAAKELKACFDRTHCRLSKKEKKKRCLEPRESYELETLLTVDARKYLTAKKRHDKKTLKQFTPEQKHAAKLLIKVFGRERVADPDIYLSPIFSPQAVDDGDDGDGPLPVYQFFMNTDSFIGSLQDPNLEERLAFRYMVSYPPSPVLSDATVTEEELEEWFDDIDLTLFRPENPFIPVTTS